ncbi:hypothetical protein EVAR_2741_1 [Eumeta japonica]|uniref:Uncharacterized protein n=1 Tax=Eumeta variegata TaxID=151549 RepID=A0A4C1T2C5_EUMVA|nr:hypothetical protein EVAR_2741_1 [Eumeta japonica]
MYDDERVENENEELLGQWQDTYRLVTESKTTGNSENVGRFGGLVVERAALKPCTATSILITRELIGQIESLVLCLGEHVKQLAADAKMLRYLRTGLPPRSLMDMNSRSGSIYCRVNRGDELPHSRPSTAVNNKNIDVVHRMIETDKHLSYHEIQASLVRPTYYRRTPALAILQQTAVIMSRWLL